MRFSEEVKATLWSMIDDMASEKEKYVIDPTKDFTRKKKWDFQTFMKFLISIEGQSLKHELHKYFGYTVHAPSNSSFNQRRSQIKAEAFEHLFRSFTKKYNSSSSRYKEYILIACDGSAINIPYNPKDIDSHHTNSSKKGYNQVRLNAMYNLLDKIYIDAIIQPTRLQNESKSFCDMLENYNGDPKTIFILDRGYEGYNNIAHALEKNVFLVLRCKDIASNGILHGLKHILPKEEEFDTNIEITLTRKDSKEIREHPERYKRVHKNNYLDYIDLENHLFYTFNFRVLRFRLSENNYECIITNLPKTEFSAKNIKELYGMRWGIETSFRELKYAIGLSNFHAKKRNYIMQEIWSRLLLYNFCEIITGKVAIKKCTKKHVYQINYSYAIHICRVFISKKAEKSPPDVEALISKEILPVRFGRHNPRKVDPKKAVSFLYRVA